MCEECPIFVGSFDDIEHEWFSDAKSLIIVVYSEFYFDSIVRNPTSHMYEVMKEQEERVRASFYSYMK